MRQKCGENVHLTCAASEWVAVLVHPAVWVDDVPSNHCGSAHIHDDNDVAEN